MHIDLFVNPVRETEAVHKKVHRKAFRVWVVEEQQSAKEFENGCFVVIMVVVSLQSLLFFPIHSGGGGKSAIAVNGIYSSLVCERLHFSWFYATTKFLYVL
jgi:hypothetical protein